MASTADSLAMVRARAKQERWEEGGWYIANEMLDARTLLTGDVLTMKNELFVPWIKAQYILNEDQLEVLLEEKAALAAKPTSSLRTDTDPATLTYEEIMDVICEERDWRLNQEALREAEEEEATGREDPPTCADCGGDQLVVQGVQRSGQPVQVIESRKGKTKTHKNFG